MPVHSFACVNLSTVILHRVKLNLFIGTFGQNYSLPESVWQFLSTAACQPGIKQVGFSCRGHSTTCSEQRAAFGLQRWRNKILRCPLTKSAQECSSAHLHSVALLLLNPFLSSAVLVETLAVGLGGCVFSWLPQSLGNRTGTDAVLQFVL